MISTKVIRKINSVEDPKLRDVFISILEEAERIVGETITKREFQEFVKATEENFRRVWQAIDALTQRVNELTERVNELAEAQKRTEERINELAEAQKKTEERLDKLTERVDTLTERLNSLTEQVNELAEAQKRTEEKLGWLIEEHRKTRQELGGLAHTFGYILEDRSYKHLPGVLKEKYQIEVIGKLRREFFEVGKGRYVEVNIYGVGRRSGSEVHIMGECKSKLSKKDVDKFMKMIRGLEEEITGDRFILFVTYHATPQVMEYVKEKGAHLVFSSEFE